MKFDGGLSENKATLSKKKFQFSKTFQPPPIEKKNRPPPLEKVPLFRSPFSPV
jgi:hypothetical protein